MCHSGGNDCSGLSGNALLSQSLLAPGEEQTWVVEAEFPGDLEIVFTWEPPTSDDDFALLLLDDGVCTNMRDRGFLLIPRHDISISAGGDGTEAFEIVYMPGQSASC